LLGISSNLDPVELTELIEVQIRYRFARIPGVAQVDVWGGFNREVRVRTGPERIKAVGLPWIEVIEAIGDANLDLPAGKIEQGKYEVMLRAPAEFTNLNQIRDTVILKRDGAASPWARSPMSKTPTRKLTRIVRVNGKRGLRVAIRKQANANTVDVSKRILAEIEAVNQAYPQINIVPVINQGNFIERSIANVARSVLYGGGTGHRGFAVLPAQHRQHAGHFSLHPHFHHRHVCLDLFRRFHHQPDDLGRSGPGGGHDGRQFHRRARKYFPPPQENGEGPREAAVDRRPGGGNRPSSPAPSPPWSFFCR
jgi:hypothetical protein